MTLTPEQLATLQQLLVNNPDLQKQLGVSAADLAGTGTTAATNPFGGSALSGLVDTALQSGAAGSTAAPNTQEVMGGYQSGTTNSTGSTDTTGTQTQAGTHQNTQQSAQTGTGTSNQSTIGSTAGTTSQDTLGSQLSQNTGQTSTTGQTQAIDTLGLGRLLQGQIGAAQGSTATTNKFLQDLVANGPQQQQALTSRAVSQATSGPGMVGAGDNARDRAASDAAATVGANSLGAQLQAASQLSGPTASTTLAGAGTPYIGQQQSGTQQTDNKGLVNTNQSTAGTNNTTNNQVQSGNTTNNTSGLSTGLNIDSLVNQSKTGTTETQAGTSTGNSAQVGVGTVPIAQQSSGGGCYVCTKFVDRGLMKPGAVRRAAMWKLYGPQHRKWYMALVGYSLYGPTLAKYNLVPRFIARLILHEECRLAGVRVKARRDAKFCHAVFHHVSEFLAIMTSTYVVKQCDNQTTQMLKRCNLLFKVN